MTLTDTLQALARLEPERFNRWDPDSAPTVYQARCGGKRLAVSTTGDVLSLAILSAALQELVPAKGWTWLRTHTNAVYIREATSDFYPLRDLGAAESATDPFALVLARAVVAALEAER